MLQVQVTVKLHSNLMSGLEIAGVLLGAFPVVISSLKHWREIAKVGGFFWRIRQEYTKCRSDVRFHEICYKQYLRELLLPIVADMDEVSRLMVDPGGARWKDESLRERLEGRLQDSYDLCMQTIHDMNDVASNLKKELSLDNSTIQSRLMEPEANRRKQPNQQPQRQPFQLSAAKSKLEYKKFRIKFSLHERVREELLNQLNKYNRHLKTLLSRSNWIATIQSPSPTIEDGVTIKHLTYEYTENRLYYLFRALQDA